MIDVPTCSFYGREVVNDIDPARDVIDRMARVRSALLTPEADHELTVAIHAAAKTGRGMLRISVTPDDKIKVRCIHE